MRVPLLIIIWMERPIKNLAHSHVLSAVPLLLLLLLSLISQRFGWPFHVQANVSISGRQYKSSIVNSDSLSQRSGGGTSHLGAACNRRRLFLFFFFFLWGAPFWLGTSSKFLRARIN